MILMQRVKKGALPAGRYIGRARRTKALVIGQRTAAAELIQLQLAAEVILRIRSLESAVSVSSAQQGAVKPSVT
ncbi:hypothetical protein [Mesorhizobium sp. WSM3862]|uniref:hypothetical protein n=1 Tax=Mesorhizobium sp. WSM3862 TaxID=632858 RepID=UPI000BAFE1BB|nr:hypothetical protein [Mesorhizobium sp. WSM3862]PBB98896.1 hypothetical protein CK224_04540 [Mesorhizobium sp. WSM3862]